MAACNKQNARTNPTVRDKLEQSKQLVQCRELRSIRCPVCGFYLLDVYGFDHYLVRVKCRKCKFDETIDTALFRTIQLRVQRKQVNNK